MNNIFTLYVIGNGFDLYHGIQSSYDNYKQWVKKYRKLLYDYFALFYDDTSGNLWKSFEENISNITLSNYVTYILGLKFEEINKRVEKYLDNQWEWRRSSPNEYSSIEIANLMTCEIFKMYEDISQTIRDWINELNIYPQEEKLVLERENSYYLTFNYTSTLEDIYQISPTAIKHIHNAQFQWDDLIFGHHRSNQYLEEYLDTTCDLLKSGKERLVYDYAKTDVLNILYSKRKDTEAVIRNIDIWGRLNRVKQINILGFSFSSVDEVYIDAIMKNVPSNAEWKISYHTENDKMRILEWVNNYRVKAEQISLIRIRELDRKYCLL